MTSPLNLGHLRRYTVDRSLFAPTTLPRALNRLGFVQADPSRTPRTVWPASRMQQADDVLAFVPERGVVRPAEVDAHFDHGSVTTMPSLSPGAIK